jgi:hypothetical protein
VIADAVYFAIAGIGFCHAAGRSMISRGFTAGMSDLMRQNWNRTAGALSELEFSTLIKKS